jgi:hypothetical protein
VPPGQHAITFGDEDASCGKLGEGAASQAAQSLGFRTCRAPSMYHRPPPFSLRPIL